MPTFINLGGYKVYFWSNENGEPVHFHVSRGIPSENSTKVWVLSDGSLMVCHDKIRIPKKDLNRILWVMQDTVSDYVEWWYSMLGYKKFYK